MNSITNYPSTSSVSFANAYNPQKNDGTDANREATLENKAEFSPAATVELTAMALYSRGRRATPQQTAMETVGRIDKALDKTGDLIKHYRHPYVDKDNMAVGHDIKLDINDCWQKSSASMPDTDEWAQWGRVEDNGRKVVLSGPQEVRDSMTALFNDLDYSSIDRVKNSYSILQRASKALHAYIA